MKLSAEGTSASGTKLLGILINVGTRHCLVPTFIWQLNLLGSLYLSFLNTLACDTYASEGPIN